MRILRAVDRARECIPLRAVLGFLRVSPSRFQAWRRRQTACALDDQSSCPRPPPHRLTSSEVQTIGKMVTSPSTVTSRLARSRSWRSGSAPCRRRLRPGTVRADVRLAPPAAPRASGKAEGRPSNNPSQRDLARRHNGHSPARRDSRLPARGDRQPVSTDLGVACR